MKDDAIVGIKIVLFLEFSEARLVDKVINVYE
jgi:hypothetical protein